MELTDKQREELETIRAKALGRKSHPYTRDARPPGGKQAFKAWARKLDALGEAWAALDADTQMQLLVAIITQWADDHSPTVPDLSLIARDLTSGLALPQHAEEDHPGLVAATKFLWRVWIAHQPGVVPIGRPAVDAIATALAPIFDLPDADAQRRVEHILRGWDKGKKVKGDLRVTDMPGRGARNFLDPTGQGTSSRPFP